MPPRIKYKPGNLREFLRREVLHSRLKMPKVNYSEPEELAAKVEVDEKPSIPGLQIKDLRATGNTVLGSLAAEDSRDDIHSHNDHGNAEANNNNDDTQSISSLGSIFRPEPLQPFIEPRKPQVVRSYPPITRPSTPTEPSKLDKLKAELAKLIVEQDQNAMTEEQWSIMEGWRLSLLEEIRRASLEEEGRRKRELRAELFTAERPKPIGVSEERQLERQNKRIAKAIAGEEKPKTSPKKRPRELEDDLDGEERLRYGLPVKRKPLEWTGHWIKNPRPMPPQMLEAKKLEIDPPPPLRLMGFLRAGGDLSKAKRAKDGGWKMPSKRDRLSGWGKMDDFNFVD